MHVLISHSLRFCQSKKLVKKFVKTLGIQEIKIPSIHSSSVPKKIMMQCFHGRKAMQDTTRPRWLKWTTYHLIVYVVMSDFNVSLAASPVLYTVGL